MDIRGLAAIVTGGASGLGASTAEVLSQGGARVSIFDLDSELGHSKAKEVGGLFLSVDVRSEPAVRKAIFEAEAVHGKARILVNCAGIGPPAKVLDGNGCSIALDDFAKVIGINLLGTFNMLSKFSERLHDAPSVGEERGVVINTASVAAFDGQIGQSAYAASKGGIVAMTLPIAREFARYEIRVMTIAPGLFWTPLLATLPQQAQDSLASQVPFPSRLGKPEEYAKLVQSIIENPMLNGEVIRLDGAIRMAPK